MRRTYMHRALLLCVTAWAVLLLDPPWLAVPGLCGHPFILAGLGDGQGGAWQTLWLTLRLNPLSALLGSVTVMLLAMMPPLLDMPMAHVHERSLARRRTRALLLFVAGYALVWLPVGLALFLASLAVRLFAGNAMVAFAFAVVVALAWQASPMKQRAHNRCHRLARLAPFGLAADADALRFGLTQGLACAQSCWALMLVPLCAAMGHVPLMMLATLFVWADRQERAAPARWRLRWPGRGLSILAALLRPRVSFSPRLQGAES